MKPPVRIILPFWGEFYAQRVIHATLPALAAPGNAPALAVEFNLEIVLVTESRLFDLVRLSPAYDRLSSIAKVSLVPLDDLITGDPGDYGPVLTFTMFRGFEDLGTAMTDYYFLFLCADFVLADGSCAGLIKRMKDLHPIIYGPSFRCNLEEVWPVLQDRLVDGVLAIPPREMVSIALRHRHQTVKARTVNWGLYHQSRMDQFYWSIGSETLVGYQWPIAIAAIKPQIAVEQPALMFDYGFVPEVCPDAVPVFMDDSDDFFMLEPQKQEAGSEMIEMGPYDQGKVIADLNLWTTRDHRICGTHPLLVHSGDLPDNTAAVIEHSRAYMTDLVRQLAPPNPHRHHPLFAAWWGTVVERITRDKISDPARPGPDTAPRSGLLSNLYYGLVGKMPAVSRCHPYWVDTHWMCAMLMSRPSSAHLLYVGKGRGLFAPLLPAAWDPVAIQLGFLPSDTAQADICVFDLSLNEAASFRDHYNALRPQLKDGCKVYLYVRRQAAEQVQLADRKNTANAAFLTKAFPDQDPAAIRFFTATMPTAITATYALLQQSLFRHPKLRQLLTAGFIALFSPVTYLVNRAAQASARFDPGWSSFVVEFTVTKHTDGSAPG